MYTDRRFRREIDEAERERFDYYSMQRQHLHFLASLVCRKPAEPKPAAWRSFAVKRYTAAGKALPTQVISVPAFEARA